GLEGGGCHGTPLSSFYATALAFPSGAQSLGPATRARDAQAWVTHPTKTRPPPPASRRPPRRPSLPRAPLPRSRDPETGTAPLRSLESRRRRPARRLLSSARSTPEPAPPRPS